MINYFCWVLMRWYLFTYIVFIRYFIIVTNTWLCISSFLESNGCIKELFGMNVDARKVWIYYNIITVWYIWMILFPTLCVWVNSSTFPIFILGKNFPANFSSSWRKHHNYLFWFLKYSLSKTEITLENWEDVQCRKHWGSIDHVEF